jgi:UDPglucose 6-dehydrogenase
LTGISIIGSGVVGTIIGTGFCQLGNDVIFYDISKPRIDQLKNQGAKTTQDIKYAVEHSDVSFLCVPTPTKNKKIDLSFIKKATKDIATALKRKNKYHVIVVKSTVTPTTTEKVIKPIIEKTSKKKCGELLGICVNPEFLTEIHDSWTNDNNFSRGFFSEERIVIGEFDKKSGDILDKLYKPLNIPIFRTDMKTAELIKYTSNCCLASRISYWNQIFLICNKLGIDSKLVAQIVSMDSRIGEYGTIHGLAYGGKCLDKDLKAFINFAKESGANPELLEVVNNINNHMKKHYGVRE